MKKRLVLGCLSIVLLFSNIGFVSAAEGIKDTEKETFRITNDIVVDGIKIGTLEINTITSSAETNNGYQITINESKDYTIYPEYQTEYGSVFLDSTEKSEVCITNDDEIYIDGEKKEFNILGINTPITSTLVIENRSVDRSDRAGIPAICHYYSNSDRTSYSFQAYESMNYNWVGEGNGHGEPEGEHISKTGIAPSNLHFQTARNDVIRFESSYNSYRESYVAALSGVAADLAAYAWLGEKGLIAVGIISAGAAGNAILKFNAAVSDAEKAYDSIYFL